MIDIGDSIHLTDSEYESCLIDMQNCCHGLSDMDWDDIKRKYNLPYHPVTLRKASQTAFGGVAVAEYYKSKLGRESVADENASLNAIRTEREKLKVERNEYLAWARNTDRFSLLVEKIKDAINDCPQFDIPAPIYPIQHSNRRGILVFGDEHYGSEFSIPSLCNRPLAEYSPEICEARIWKMMAQTLEIAAKEQFDEISVYDVGDMIDGVLRVGQIRNLRYGVVESSIRFGTLIAQFLGVLSASLKVKFYMTNGNHSELRMLGQPKGTFADENMGDVIAALIAARLENNPNVEIIRNQSGMIFENVCGYNVLGIHGEAKDMSAAIASFSQIYGVDVDYLVAGHVHHGKSETVAFNKEVINVPSIMGGDPYGLSLNRMSNPGASFLIFEDGKGKVQEYNIKF